MSTPLSPDRTPGPHPVPTAEGAVAVRRPGGRLPVEALRHLLSVAERWGDGRIHLTRQAALEVHGLPLEHDGTLPIEVADAVHATGLVPPTHDRVRTVLCSPLPSTDRPDLHPMAAELDEELLDIPLLEDLPDGFTWALDDGTGVVAGEPWDLCYQAGDEDAGTVAVRGGHAWHISRVDAVPTMVALAQEFQLARTQAETPAAHPDELGFPLGEGVPDPAAPAVRTAEPPPIGTYGSDLLAGVPNGELTGEMVRALPALSEVTLTPWWQVLVPRGADQAATYAAAGFQVDRSSGGGR